MVLYSGVSDMFQYNSADGMIDSINVDIVMGGGALVNTPALVQCINQVSICISQNVWNTLDASDHRTND